MRKKGRGTIVVMASVSTLDSDRFPGAESLVYIIIWNGRGTRVYGRKKEKKKGKRNLSQSTTTFQSSREISSLSTDPEIKAFFPFSFLPYIYIYMFLRVKWKNVSGKKNSYWLEDII